MAMRHISPKVQSASVPVGATIDEVLKKIDDSTVQIALVVAHNRLCGTVTDGDVRRGLLRGVALTDSVTSIMNSRPKVGFVGESREVILDRMRQLFIRHLPILDCDGYLVDLELMSELMAPPKLQNGAIIMAGGLGKRLAPLTNDCPKPMLKVGGRPILETVLINLIEHGFHRFSIAVNYRAEKIVEYFGDGSAWGVSIDYLRESEPLGTAGALSLLATKPDAPMIVMNGDILTKVNFRHLLEFHQSRNSEATMCVRDFELQVPYGVVKIDNYQIAEIEEKPTQKFFVNAGIYVLSPSVLNLVPRAQRIDMTDLFKRVIQLSKPHAVFPIREYWADVGHHRELADAQREFETTFR